MKEQATHELEFKNRFNGWSSWVRFKTNKIAIKCLTNALKEVGVEVNLTDTKYRGCKNPS